MFSFFDCDNYSVITLKCQPDRIEELKMENSCIGKPFNMSPKIGLALMQQPPQMASFVS